METWPKERRVLGTHQKRVDAKPKVTGRAKYSSDQQPRGCLVGMMIRSRWAAAKINAVDLDALRQRPGIKAALLVQDLPRPVRFYGEEIAAVAAVSREAALDALRAVKIDAVAQPFVVAEQTAVSPDAPQVFAGKPNAGAPRVTTKGRPDDAFAQCAAVIEAELATPVHIHHPLETHGVTAQWDGDEVTLWASTQGVFGVRDQLAGALNIPQNKVRVICEYMGGGFGGKFELGVEGLMAARLAREAGAPVRFMLPRHEEALAVGNRPSAIQRIKLGAGADGKLLAFEMHSCGTAGYQAGQATAGGGGGADFPAPYIYAVPNIRVRHWNIGINAGSARAFRAPGHPQASFGMEAAMDELAVKMGIDPVEFRLRNDPDPDKVRLAEWRLAAERFGWKAKYRRPGSSPGPVKTGIGCAGATWGGGGWGTKAEVQINPDSTVEIRCGTQDLGTGTKTVIATIAAEVFGLTTGDIVAKIGDTRYPPSGGSGGSTTAASVSPAVFDACTKALAELKAATKVEDPRGANWKGACARLGVQPLVVQGAWREGLSSRGVGGVQMAEVEVDTGTGFVRVRKILCVQDCGLVVSKLTCESQVNGGIIMGLGYALYEQRQLDPLTGVVLNPDFERNKLPMLADLPEIDIVLLDQPERGVIGIGEPVTIPTAAAIGNAVANAIGVRVCSLPITPDKVLDALGRAPAPHPERIDWSALPAPAAKPGPTGLNSHLAPTEAQA